MATNRTFTMIKPDATGAGNTGKIIDRIIGAGFTIKAMKWTQLSMNDAAAFYAVHKDRPFFGELTEYMTSAPIVAAILEKDNAVADFRTLIGATNPEEAAPGTIRADFAQSIAANAVHGSDSDENAAIEAARFSSAPASSRKSAFRNPPKDAALAAFFLDLWLMELLSSQSGQPTQHGLCPLPMFLQLSQSKKTSAKLSR